MTEAPREIWAEMVHESHPAYPYEGRFHVDQNAFGGTRYVRADAISLSDALSIPEVAALVEAMRRIVNMGQSAEPDHWNFRVHARNIAADALRKIEEGRG